MSMFVSKPALTIARANVSVATFPAEPGAYGQPPNPATLESKDRTPISKARNAHVIA
jgi:hypothetical protein